MEMGLKLGWIFLHLHCLCLFVFNSYAIVKCVCGGQYFSTIVTLTHCVLYYICYMYPECRGECRLFNVALYIEYRIVVIRIHYSGYTYMSMNNMRFRGMSSGYTVIVHTAWGYNAHTMHAYNTRLILVGWVKFHFIGQNREDKRYDMIYTCACVLVYETKCPLPSI